MYCLYMHGVCMYVRTYVCKWVVGYFVSHRQTKPTKGCCSFEPQGKSWHISAKQLYMYTNTYIHTYIHTYITVYIIRCIILHTSPEREAAPMLARGPPTNIYVRH